MNIQFTPTGWREYVEWLAKDRSKVAKINRLIKSIMADGALSGEGKPERLKHIDAYSRHVDDANRLVYQV